MRTVFLSSTFKDLTEHRNAVLAAVNSLDGYKCIAMEQFGARDGIAVRFDREAVLRADLFVGIVGHIYGSVDVEKKKSYTELEFDAARAAGKPRLIFLSREDMSLPITLVESDEMRRRQTSFRARISAERVRDTFTSPADLAERVVRAISNWQNSSELRRELVRPLPPQSCFEHPYPIQENFVGRQTERKCLTEWMSVDDRRVLCLTAMGGMGKSAVTWAWLQRDVLGLPLPGSPREPAEVAQRCRLSGDERPHGVFWWSFYEGEASFSSFLESALYYASGGEFRPSAPEADSDKVRALVALLHRNRFLFVLDGFERQLSGYSAMISAYSSDDVSDRDRLFADANAKLFFRHFLASPGESRILITSRLLPLELADVAGCRKEQLVGVDPDDAEIFLRAQGVQGSSVEIRSACERYGFHALALRLLAGLVVNDSVQPGHIRAAPEFDARNQENDEQTVDQRLRGHQHHVLKLAYERLAPQEQILLSQIAAFRFPVTYTALEKALCRSDSDALAGNWLTRKISGYFHHTRQWHKARDLRGRLTRLIERGLMFFDRERGRYDLHPIVRHYAYDRLVDKAGTHLAVRDYFAVLPDSSPANVKTIEDLAPAIELYHHTILAGFFDQALQLFVDRLQDPLLKKFCAAETYSSLVGAMFPNGRTRPPSNMRAYFQRFALTCLARSFRLRGEPRRAIEVYSEVLAKAADSSAWSEQGVVFLQLAMAEILVGELHASERHLYSAIELCTKQSMTDYVHLARETLACLRMTMGAFDQADKDLSLLATTAETYNRAEMAAARKIWNRDVDGALTDARRAQQIADAAGYELDRIRSRCLLGTVLCEYALLHGETKRDALAEADRLLRDARQICLRVKLVELEPDIELARAKWSIACRNPSDAEVAANDALFIAETSGYRLKRAEIRLTLAEIAMLQGDTDAARKHLGQARDAAECSGGSHQYWYVLQKADQLEQSWRRADARAAG